MRQPVTDLPTLVENQAGTLQSAPMGGMACSYARFVAGTDLAPLLAGLPDDACPCPHWGYILEGAIRITYADGRDEVLRAGEIFYLPPGHAAVFLERHDLRRVQSRAQRTTRSSATWATCCKGSRRHVRRPS